MWSISSKKWIYCLRAKLFFSTGLLRTQKRCITRELPGSRAPPLIRSIHSQDRRNSCLGNVSLKMQFFIVLLLGKLLIKAQFCLIASCPLRKVIRASMFFHISIRLNISSTIIMPGKGSIKSLPCIALLLPFYELMKLGVLAKWTFKWP